MSFGASIPLLVIVLVGSSCVTPSKSSRNDSAAKSESNADQKSNQEDDFYVSGNLGTLTLSLSNNPQTSKRVDRKDANEFASRLEQAIRASEGDDRKAIVALMSLRRISGEGLAKVNESARQLVAYEMTKDVNRGLPEFAKLELVLAAIQAKKYSYAEHFIYDLIESKNKKIRAAARTAEGLIAASDQRLPEAMVSWNKALEEVPDFAAAQLNIGFYAAKYGDFPLAKKMLSGMQDDWFAVYGLATAERMTRDNDRASALCKRVVDAKPRFKPALFNCALHAHQGVDDSQTAKTLIDRAAQISGNSEIDERISGVRESIAKSPVKDAKGSTPKKSK
jgi:tetratricopeptide (TPR) repeat protein